MEYLDAAVAFARTHWTQFDSVSSLLGIALFAAALYVQTKDIRWGTTVSVFTRRFCLDGCGGEHPDQLMPLARSCCSMALPISRTVSSSRRVTSPVRLCLVMIVQAVNGSGSVGMFTAFLALLLARDHLQKRRQMPIQHSLWLCLSAIFLSSTVMGFVGTVRHSSSNTSHPSHKESSWIPVAGYIFLPLLGTTLHRLYRQQGKRQSPLETESSIRHSLSFCLFAANLFLVGWNWMQRDLKVDWTVVDPNSIAQLVYLISLCGMTVHLLLHLLTSQPQRDKTCLLICMDLLPSILLVSGKIGCLVWTATLWELLSFRSLIFSNRESDTTEMKSFGFGLVGHYAAMHVFFHTEHYCEFSGLHFTAAFIGFPDFEYYTSGMLLALETFSGWILMPFLLSCLCPPYAPSQHVLSAYLTARSYLLFLSMTSANIMRRHLWTYRTFAPKFVFELAFLIVTDLSVLCATLLHKSGDWKRPGNKMM